MYALHTMLRLDMLSRLRNEMRSKDGLSFHFVMIIILSLQALVNVSRSGTVGRVGSRCCTR